MVNTTHRQKSKAAVEVSEVMWVPRFIMHLQTGFPIIDYPFLWYNHLKCGNKAVLTQKSSKISGPIGFPQELP